MSRLIDADELIKVKFHPLPYTHIVPADLLKEQTEAYKRGWNDAIDAIMECAETVEPQQWIPVTERLPEANEIDEKGFIKAYLVQDARWMDVARWDGKFWIAWGYGTVLKNVVAWQELPMPYRGGEEK